MKKKQKAIVKESKKVAKKELTEQIINALRTVTANLPTVSKKTEKLITKQAKQLAKKLASGATKSQPAKPAQVETPTNPIEKKTIKKTSTKKEETPA